jgi:hypothetical protein
MKNLTALLVLSVFYIPVAAKPGSGSDGSGITPKKKSPQTKVAQLKSPPLCPEANAGSDVSITCGGSTTLGTADNINYTYSWSPSTGLSSSTIFNPVASPSATTTYTLTMTAKSNLLVNGDFESGNTGFYSDYSYPLTSGVSVYTVGSSASAIYNWWCSTSPASGSNMLIGDGAIWNGERVWYQTVSVQPNSLYSFSGKFLNLFSTGGVNDPNIVVKINGSDIALQTLSFGSCGWQTVSGTWNSGSATSATIAIYADPTTQNAGWGNDFAIDDLVLAPNCPQTTDDVTVTVNPITITPDWSSLTHTNIPPLTGTWTVPHSIGSDGTIQLCRGYDDFPGWYRIRLVSSQSSNNVWSVNGTTLPDITQDILTSLDHTSSTVGMPNYSHEYKVTDASSGCESIPVRIISPATLYASIQITSLGNRTYRATTFFYPAGTTYNWVVDNGNTLVNYISGQGTNLLIFSYPSWYSATNVPVSLTVNSIYGCVNSEPGLYVMPVLNAIKKPASSVTIQPTTEKNEAEITLFPNPAREWVSINSSETFEKIQLYTSTGVLKKLHAGKGNYAKISISDFQSGIYYVTVIYKNRIQTQRLVVVK